MDRWRNIKITLEFYWKDIQDKLGPLIRRKPILAICATMVPVIIIIFFAVTLPTMKKSSIPSVVRKEWYYDLNTGKLFKSKVGQAPPIEAPSGPLEDGRPAGVRAYVFYKAGNNEKIVGFLEKELPLEINSSNDLYQPVSMKLIKKIEGDRWIPATSEAGRTIAREYFSNSNYTRCQP